MGSDKPKDCALRIGNYEFNCKVEISLTREEGEGVDLGVCSRYIVTTRILPRDFERPSRYKAVTRGLQGATFCEKASSNKQHLLKMGLTLILQWVGRPHSSNG